MCGNLISHFSRIDDWRSEKNKLYPLEEILLLCICAVVSGAEGWKDIATFGRIKLDWLRRFLPYENGIPSEDCIAWVMAGLSPKAFQECFAAWMQSVAQLTEGEIVAIDGKTLRRSYDRRNGRGAIHMVSAWADANRLSLGQVATEEKSNEITAIPKLLDLLEIKGCIVTIDAMGCQTAIAEKIVAAGADYVLAVKDNQAQLHEAIRDYFDTALAADFRDVPFDYAEHTDAGHGRCEVRRHWLVDNLSTLPEPEKWAKLQGIGMVESERHQGEHVSRERRYYIVTFADDAEVFAHAVRAHWGVENRLHWSLDVTFGEDDSRIRRENAPANFNTLRQFGLNLLKRYRPPMSVRQKRYKATLDDEFRANVLLQK